MRLRRRSFAVTVGVAVAAALIQPRAVRAQIDQADADAPRDHRLTTDQVRRWFQVEERELQAPVPEFAELAREVARGTTDIRVLRAYHRLYPRLYPFESAPPADTRIRALAARRALGTTPLGREGEDVPPDPGRWNFLGPTNIPGRMTAIALHPTEPETVFAAGADGGVWKTTDLGDTWTPLGDFEATLAIGALAIDPVDPDILYVGTGEGNYAGDNIGGIGVMKTTDGGQNWSVVAARFTFGFHDLVIDPSDRNRLWAATRSGLFRSDDAGSNWNQVGGGLPAEDVFAVLISGGTAGRMFATVGSGRSQVTGSGLWRSDDAGTSWSLVSGFPSGGDFGRAPLAQCAGTPSRMYAAIHDLGSGGVMGIHVSDDEGATWTQVGNPTSTCFNFCWYCLTFAVDPVDPDLAYVGGVSIYRTTDGGQNWSRVNSVGPDSYVHVDQHHFLTPAAGTLWSANDGGINRSTDDGTTWDFVGESLGTAQYYHITTDPTDPSYATGGTQDNGTHRFRLSSEWDRILGGDGAYTAIDWNDPRVWYGSSQGLNMARSRNRGSAFVAIGAGIDGADPRAFIAPFILDRGNPSTVLAGTNRLWRSTDQGDNFSAISVNLSPAGGVITSIDNCRDIPSAIYVGTSRGELWYTADTGLNWSERTAGLPGNSITSVTVHPSVREIAFVSVGGTGVGHVWRTDDAGVSWVDVTGGLPDMHVNQVLLLEDAPTTLIAATDMGAYRSDDEGQNWRVMGDDLPNVAVDRVSYSPLTNVVLAGTHGRGAWQYTPPDSCPLAPNFPGLRSLGIAPTATGCVPELSWLQAISNCSLAPSVSYNIYRSEDPLFVPDLTALIAAGETGTSYCDLSVVTDTTYHYLVRAEDGQSGLAGPANGGREDINQNRARATVGDPLASGTFDDDAGDASAWLGSTTWSITDVANTTPAGTYSYVSAPAGLTSYLAGQCAALTTPTFVVEAGATLQYQASYNIEIDWDGVVVELTTDAGQSWVDLPPDGGYPADLNATRGNGCSFPPTRGVFGGPANNTAPTPFAPFSHDLAAYVGQAVQIRWLLTSDGGAEFEGFFLDDVQVTAVSTPAAPAAGNILRGVREAGRPRFHWTDIAGASGYLLYHGLQPDLSDRAPVDGAATGAVGVLDTTSRTMPVHNYSLHAHLGCGNEGP